MDVSPEDAQNIIHNPVLEAKTITFEVPASKPSKMEDASLRNCSREAHHLQEEKRRKIETKDPAELCSS